MDSQALLDLTLPRSASAAGVARHALAEAGLPGGPETRHATALLTTELITNAVLHGCGDDVRIQVAQVGERLRVEVRDDGQGFDPAQRTEREDPGGWGLAVVETLSSDWGMYRGSTHVWFELAL